ncbi:MAG: phosphoribosylaminoimidazolesuccinocarboxamide synthase [Oscillospiraceae bacterium]|nr:phosphoribosylaminoimidazolesuccinocarboxamide synthase [Oscillospiraceae bacterium]
MNNMICNNTCQSVLYEGKSKLICKGIDDDSLIIRYKDTLTAFNGEKKEVLSGKGKLNAAISNLLYDYLEKNGIETHIIRQIDETSTLVKKADIVMVEVIVRNIAAGSFSKKYGVAEGTPLKNTTVEFSVKSDKLGDPLINASQITAIGLAAKQELDEMVEKALLINTLVRALFKKAGITLVDFKLEFGRYKGRLILCDEISPDSCRLWAEDTGNKLDKDLFRQDLGDVLDGYRKVLFQLTMNN